MPSDIIALLLFAPVLHTGANAGALSGFLHPLLGLEHMLAMVAVGLLSAQLGGRAIWTVPVTFVAVMAVGGVLGLLGVPLPAIRFFIALSVVILGAAIALKSSIPVGVAMLFVGIFALFHGYAHGADLPSALNTPLEIISYVIGFLIATAGLHVVGALLGTMAERSRRGDMTLRIGGALIALLGVGIVMGVL